MELKGYLSWMSGTWDHVRWERMSEERGCRTLQVDDRLGSNSTGTAAHAASRVRAADVQYRAGIVTRGNGSPGPAFPGRQQPWEWTLPARTDFILTWICAGLHPTKHYVDGLGFQVIFPKMQSCGKDLKVSMITGVLAHFIIWLYHIVALTDRKLSSF